MNRPKHTYIMKPGRQRLTECRRRYCGNQTKVWTMLVKCLHTIESVGYLAYDCLKICVFIMPFSKLVARDSGMKMELT